MTNRRRRPRGAPEDQGSPRHPTVRTAAGRTLTCFPAAVLAFIVDDWGRFLLLRKPGQTGWEVVSGALQAGETVPQGVLREVKEEAGPELLAVYKGVIDTFVFEFDARLPALISICCLLRYRGGEVHPGADAKDAEFRWWDISRLDDIELVVPRGRWDLLTRAVDQASLFRGEEEPEPEQRDPFLF